MTRLPEPASVLLLHASAVQLDGSALLFLGPSGTGKSTICHLMSECANPLADDKVYIMPQAGRRWSIADASERFSGGPLSKQEIRAIESVPLQIIFRLRQSSLPCLEPTQAVEACYELTKAFFDIFWQILYDTKTKKSAFANLAAIARSVPVYDLYFDRTPQTLKIITRAAAYHQRPARR